MLGLHLDSPQTQMAVVLPRPRGGVAPSRHEVALAGYLEKQWAHRQQRVLGLRNARTATVLWNLILGVCRTLPARGTTVSHPRMHRR